MFITLPALLARPSAVGFGGIGMKVCGALKPYRLAVPQSYLSPRLSPYWCCSCSFLRKILVISAAAGVL